MANGNKTAAATLGMSCIAMLLWAAWWVFVVWAIVHFIFKYW